MIGDGWDGDPAMRPGPAVPIRAARRIAVVTGTRAEFGLLRPVMHAVAKQPSLELAVIAAGSHLISPALTFRDVKAEFAIADSVPMQVAGKVGRLHDAESLGRGIARFARSFESLRPDIVLVLGDRIEAFAAASAASVGGFVVAHVHGGDRAEGIADEAMRHAITKLSHIHFPATALSRERIVRMGERPEHVHLVGSPAVDELETMAPLPDDAFAELGSPDCVLLMHPIGRSPEMEEAAAAGVLAAISDRRVLALEPNFDPGREGTVAAIRTSGVRSRTHLPRKLFIGMLRCIQRAGGVLVGNSSAGLIEAAVLRLRVVDIGERQAGRERPGNVVHASGEQPEAVRAAVREALGLELSGLEHPYGDGRSGARIAMRLAEVDLGDPSLLRKRCAY
jgi:UDP-hydrolysing UDP-N-acetyl-D-glucosamine 2-epimerase